ncbi:MAG: FAD binding domain-containing protein [Bacteroidetes bacterium]|nr:FAD binding domain-containing protein [Bacteroidota bacterium]
MVSFILNENEVSTALPPGMLLLDFIRYRQHLKGTKIGCREGDCGACTILVGEIAGEKMRYRTATSCLMPIGNANGKHIVTIEGINSVGLNAIQQAMVDEGATQCGFCTPGFVMSFAGHCMSGNEPTKKNAIASIDGNICRCTGYKSIERAATRINDLLIDRREGSPSKFAVENKILPEYFSQIEARLKLLNGELVILKTDRAINFLAGGTDLYVQKHDSMTNSDIRFLSEKSFLKGISKEGNRCRMGASTTVTDLCESEIILAHFPHFTKFAKLVSSTQIRNMATLAGNFVNASPIGDFTVYFLALDAVLVLSDGDKMRELPLRNFYKGYKVLDKKPEEFLEKIYFELPEEHSKFNFEKVSKRTHLDIASVNTAMKLTMSGNMITKANVSAGGVAPVPLFLTKASAFLSGKSVSPETVEEAIHIAQTEISPISDTRGSEEYKRLLLSQLIKAHFIELFPELES